MRAAQLQIPRARSGAPVDRAADRGAGAQVVGVPRASIASFSHCLSSKPLPARTLSLERAADVGPLAGDAGAIEGILHRGVFGTSTRRPSGKGARPGCGLELGIVEIEIACAPYTTPSLAAMGVSSQNGVAMRAPAAEILKGDVIPPTERKQDFGSRRHSERKRLGAGWPRPYQRTGLSFDT